MAIVSTIVSTKAESDTMDISENHKLNCNTYDI